MIEYEHIDEERIEIIEYEHIVVEEAGRSESGKTGIYTVVNKRAMYPLGSIRWNAAWRQYVFVPRSNTIYSAGCLDDIAAFIRQARLADPCPHVTRVA